jgi:hypothetical protein
LVTDAPPATPSKVIGPKHVVRGDALDARIFNDAENSDGLPADTEAVTRREGAAEGASEHLGLR